MAETKTRWTGLFPQVDGYYWMRLDADDTVPTIIRYEARQLYEVGNADDIRWNSYLQSAQFLGPVSHSDAEQLIELRRISGLALSTLRRLIGTLDSGSQRGMAQDAESIANRLHAALNPKQQGKETQ